MKEPPKETFLSSKVEIKHSQVGGKGMFAKEPINKDETVIVWGGEYTNKEGALRAKQEGKHVMQWDEDVYSVEVRGEDPGYFINHSCDPNVWMTDAFTLITRKAIKKDEE